MNVIQILLLGLVAWYVFKGPARWVIIAALLVSYWFPQVGKTLDQGVDMVVNLVQTAVGRL